MKTHARSYTSLSRGRRRPTCFPDLTSQTRMLTLLMHACLVALTTGSRLHRPSRHLGVTSLDATASRLIVLFWGRLRNYSRPPSRRRPPFPAMSYPGVADHALQGKKEKNQKKEKTRTWSFARSNVWSRPAGLSTNTCTADGEGWACNQACW
jgi:hypothetical protein